MTYKLMSILRLVEKYIAIIIGLSSILTLSMFSLLSSACEIDMSSNFCLLSKVLKTVLVGGFYALATLTLVELLVESSKKASFKTVANSFNTILFFTVIFILIAFIVTQGFKFRNFIYGAF